MIFDKLFLKSKPIPLHYLDNSATDRFKPPSVINAVKYHLTHSANPGRGGHSESIRALSVLESCRESIRTLTGLPNVILTKSCTEALNLAIFSLAKAGTVITDCFSHNAVLRPLYKLEKEGLINLKILYPKSVSLTKEELSESLTSDTQTVILTEMSNVTGAITDIPAIAPFLAERGINLIVDAAQSMGHLFHTYKGVTALASSGHKGLHGMQGTGFLALAKDAPTMTPILYGGTGTEAESPLQPLTLPEGYESGTQNTPGYAALAEGINWTLSHRNSLTNRLTALATYLSSELSSIPALTLFSPPNSPIQTFNHASLSPSELSDILSSRGICVRSGLHCAPLIHSHLGTLPTGGAVRASLGYSTTLQDLYDLLSTLRSL